jgi:hypothetical protein
VWDNPEKYIVRWIYPEKWTWDDFYEAIQQRDELFSTVSHTVHVIVDVRHSSFIPSGVMARGRYISTGNRRHPQEGITVIVGANAFIRGLYDVYSKVYTKLVKGIDVFFVTTLDEAYQIIEKRHLAGEPTAS